MLRLRHSAAITARIESRTDGTSNDQTGVGGWAAVTARSSSGRETGTSIYQMELRAVVAAVKMAEGTSTVVTDYEWLARNAQRDKPQTTCRPLWREVFAAAESKDVTFEWRKRDQSLGSRLAHQLARSAVRVR